MNYYERHLGDYAKDTAHLTMLEHGAYNLLLDRYYATEVGIPVDQAHRVARARSREEKSAVDAVLEEFFSQDEGVWKHSRAGKEIIKAQTKIKAAQENGKRGGRKKDNPDGTHKEPTGLSLGSKNETGIEAHQTPDTRHQAPDTKPSPVPSDDDGTPNGARVAVAEWPCPEKIIEDLGFLHGVERNFAELEVVEFRAFWAGKTALTVGEWDAKFLQRCRDQWDRSQQGRRAS